MAQELETRVRRARVSDAGKIAAFVNLARAGRVEVDERAIIERFGNVGFLLAERGGHLVGMLGWQVENLVVRVTDLLVWVYSPTLRVYSPTASAPPHSSFLIPHSSFSERVVVGRALFAEMERTATELQCEAALLFLRYPGSPQAAEFCKMLEYEPRIVASLPKMWQEAAYEARISDDESVWIKQLRADRVVQPV